MGTIKINLKEQCLWHGWYRILSLRFPEASREWVVNEVNKIVYKNWIMTEHEIFEKLKEALDYNYMYDSLEFSEERKEVDNLEDYLRIIKQ